MKYIELYEGAQFYHCDSMETLYTIRRNPDNHIRWVVHWGEGKNNRSSGYSNRQMKEYLTDGTWVLLTKSDNYAIY